MKLSTQQPTTSGHFWLLKVGETRPGPFVKVIVWRDSQFWVCDTHDKEYGTPLSWFPPQYKWAGPLIPPNE